MWRRLIELRVFPTNWVITPAFPEQMVRLSYPFNEGCQSILVSRSPDYYPVQLSNVRSFSIKSEVDIFEATPSIFPSAGLAFKAIPRNFEALDEAFCRVLIEVQFKAPEPTGEKDQQQDEILSIHTQQIQDLQGDVETLMSEAPEVWQVPDLENGWQPFGAPLADPSYRQDRGRVYFRGGLANGLLTASAFTLPMGYAPSTQLVLPTVSVGAGRLDIYPDGSVIPLQGDASFISLDGLSYWVG